MRRQEKLQRLGAGLLLLLHLQIQFANLAREILGTIKCDLGTILEGGLVLVRVRVNEQLDALSPVVHELLNCGLSMRFLKEHPLDQFL